MAGIVKKGYVDVKKKGMLGSSYKRRYIVLRRNADEGTKAVEIMEHENDMDEVECLPLTGVWTVQDRSSQNKRRYAFELVIGPHIIMTFSCPSLTEREEWTESFHILNRVSSYSPPLNAPDMYPVSLERSISTVEIGVSGPCLLRIQDGAIVLYSECGRNKLHHWAAENVKNLTLAKEQLILEAYRPGSDDTLMEFSFNTDVDICRQILTSWNMALMESVDPQKLNSISKYILSHQKEKEGPKSVSLSRNFFGSLKQRGMNGSKDDKGVVRRVRSFSEKGIHDIRLSPDSQVNMVASQLSIASQHSQESSYTINAVPQQVSDEEHRLSPPPIPPRAPRRPHSLGMDFIDSTRPDPDYSYIHDDEPILSQLEVKSVKSVERSQNPASVDKQLDDLLRDIVEDNQRKQRRLTLDPTPTVHKTIPAYEKSRTLATMRYNDKFAKRKKEFYHTHGPSHEASDYLEPVPSQRVKEQEKRASNPPQLITEQEDLLRQIKRHSTSGDFTRSTIPNKDSSHHDYSIIPDKIIPGPMPQHFHTASTDSTQSAPELPPRLRRSQGPIEEPPSPPSSGTSPIKPTTNLHLSLNTGSMIEAISPYATSKDIILDGLQKPIPRDPSPPPLPPRSPVRHLRERVSMTAIQRCSHCNGMKHNKQSLTKTLSLAEHHHRYHHDAAGHDCGSLPDLWKDNFSTDPTQSISQPFGSQVSYTSQSSNGSYSKGHCSEKPHSRTPSLSSDEVTPTSASGKESLESALQKLDECVKDLESGLSPEESPPPLRNQSKNLHMNVGEALTNTQQIQNDLLLAKKENRRSTEHLNRVLAPHTSKHPLPSTKRSMTIHHSSPAISEKDLSGTAPPTVPPRSLVSLDQTSNPQLDSLPHLAAAAHTPIHRYLSQNTAEKSNTVFIYHMKDPVRIGRNSMV